MKRIIHINYIRLFIITAFVTILNSSCNKGGYKVTPSGLHYHIYESNGKRKPVEGDIMMMHLIYKNSKDSVLYDSKVLGDSFLIELIKPSFRGGLEEGFAMMGIGDSASFLLVADSIFGKLFHKSMPSYIHNGELLRFDVKLLNILSREEMHAMLQQKIQSKVDKEKAAIEEFLRKNNMPVNMVKPGVYFYSFLEGKGMKPEPGDQVTVKYIIRSLDGKIFDSSSENGGKLTLTLGDSSYISEWMESIASMKKGGVSRLILSSDHAYKGKQFGPIPPDIPLIFDLELTDVQKASGH